ncbi:hypothetical protein EVA_20942, partial [gut metagenome]
FPTACKSDLAERYDGNEEAGRNMPRFGL